jgi:hypothetical protein
MAVQFDRAQAANAVSSIKPAGNTQAEINTLHQILTGKPAPSKRYTPPTIKPKTLSQNYGQFFVPHTERTSGMQGDGGGFLSALGGIAGPALGLLAKPLSIVASTAKETIDFTQALVGVGDWSDVSAKQWAKQSGLMGWNDYYTFGKLLHDEDWLQDTHLGQLTIPGVGWKWDVNASFLAAAPFDIALDPLAWVTFGLGKTAQVANVLNRTSTARKLIGKVVGKEAADAAEAAARAAGYAVDDATRAAFRETGEILGDQVSKAAIGDTVADTRKLINNMLSKPTPPAVDPGDIARIMADMPVEPIGKFFNIGGRPLNVQISDTAIREIQDIARASAKHIQKGRSAITSDELNTVAKAMQRLGLDQNILDAGEYAASRAARGLPEKAFKPLFDVGDDAARSLLTPRGMVKNQIGLKIPGTGPIGRPVINKLTRQVRDPRGWDEMTKPIGISLISGSNKFVDDAIRFIPQSTRKLVFGLLGAPFRRTASYFGSEGSKVKDIIRTSNNPLTVMSAKAFVRSAARGNAMTRKAQAELTTEAAKFVDTTMSQLPADLDGLSREQVGELVFRALDGDVEARESLGPAFETARNFWESIRQRAHDMAGMEFIAERPNYVPHQPTEDAMEIIGRNFGNPDDTYSGGSFTRAGFERGRGYVDEEEYRQALMDWARKNYADDFGEGGWDAMAASKKTKIEKAFRNEKNSPTDEFMHEKLLKPGIDPETGENIPGVAEQIAQIMRRHGITHELFNQNAFTVLPQYVTALSKRIGDVHIEKLLLDEGTLLGSWTTSVDIPTVQMAEAAATMRSYSRKVANAKRNVSRAFLEANAGHVSADRLNVERFKYAEKVWKQSVDEYEAELEIFEEFQALHMERIEEYNGAVAAREELEERIYGAAREIQELEDLGSRQAATAEEVRRLANLRQEQRLLQEEIIALEMGRSQATGYQDGIYYGLWERASAAVGTKLFIEKAVSRGFGDVATAERFAKWYADEFQKRIDAWRLANPDIDIPPSGDAWGTAEGNSPMGLMDDPELIFDPENKAIPAVVGRKWMEQVARAIDEHHIGEWMMLQDVDQFIPKSEGVYNGASSAIFAGLRMVDDLAADYIGQLDQMVAKYTSLNGGRDLPPPIQRYQVPTQEQLNKATDLIISYNNMTPEERIDFAFKRMSLTGDLTSRVVEEASASTQLQMDLKEAMRLHFSVYGGDNLISIKTADDIDALAGQYAQGLKQRAGWLEEVLQESPIAQLEMSVPNPMVSQAEKMDLGTYATLLQFRDRMMDSVQNGAGLRMRLGVSLEEIESGGVLMSREELATHGIRVDGAGDPVNVAGMNQSVARDGLKTTFYKHSDVMKTGRIYAVQTPVNPKGHRNAYNTAISSALHRELGLPTDNIALEFADTGVPVIMRELEFIDPWYDEFYQEVAMEGVAGKTLTLDVNGDVKALSADRWRARQSLGAQTVIDSQTGEVMRREARIVRAVNSDVELIESLAFDLLTGNPNPYGRNMDNYRLTRYGTYSRSGFGSSFDEIAPPPAEVVDPTPPPAAAPEILDRPLTTDEVSELDVSELALKEELKPKKPTKGQKSFIDSIESVNNTLDKMENRPDGFKRGVKAERKGPGFVRWANAVGEVHPELVGQAGVDTSRSSGMVIRARGRSEKVRIVYKNIKYVNRQGKEVTLTAEEAWKRLRDFTNDYLERLKRDPDATPKATRKPSELAAPVVEQKRLDALQEMKKTDLHKILIERDIRGWTKQTKKEQLIVKILVSEGVRPSDVAAEARGLVEEAVAKTPALSQAARRKELDSLTVRQLRSVAGNLAVRVGERPPSQKMKKDGLKTWIMRREFKEDLPEQTQAAVSPEPVEKVARKSLSAQEQAAQDYRDSLRGARTGRTTREPVAPSVEAPPNRAEIAERRRQRQERRAAEVTQGARDVDIAEAVRLQEELPAVFPEPGSPDYPGIEDINVFRTWIAEYDQVFQNFQADMDIELWEQIRDSAYRVADAYEGQDVGGSLGVGATDRDLIAGSFAPQENPMFPVLWESAETVRNFVRSQGFNNRTSPKSISVEPTPGIVLDAPEPQIKNLTEETLTYRREVPERKPAVRDIEPETIERALEQTKQFFDELEETTVPLTRKARREELLALPKNELREIGENLARQLGQSKPKNRKKNDWIRYIIRREFQDGAQPVRETPTAETVPVETIPTQEALGERIKEVQNKIEVATENLKAAQAREAAETAMDDAVAAAENLDSTGRFKALFDALGYVPSRQMQDILDSYGRSLKANGIDIEEKIIAQIDTLLGIRGKYGSWQNFINHHTGIGLRDFFLNSEGIPLAQMLENRTQAMAELVGLPFYAENSDELLKAQAVRLLGSDAETITDGMDRKDLLDLLRTESGGHGVETRATAESPHIQQPGMFYGRVGGLLGNNDVPWIDGSAANYTVAVDGYLSTGPDPMVLNPDEFARFVMNVSGETPLRIYGVYPWMEAAANQRVRGMSPDTQLRAAGEVLNSVRRNNPLGRLDGTQFQAVLAEEAKAELNKMIPPYLRGLATLGQIATDIFGRVDASTFDDLLNFADGALTGRKYTVATRALGRNHSWYTVNVDAYENLVRGGFVDRTKLPPKGGEKYSWVGLEGDEAVRDLTLREIHQEIWKDNAVGLQWANDWLGANHKFGHYGEPWQYSPKLAPLTKGNRGAGFDPVRAAVNSVRLAKIWERTPEIANRFKRPGMENSVFQEIMLFIGWRDSYLWQTKATQADGALGSLVQVTPTQMDDIDTLISKYLNATSPTTNKDWATHVLNAYEGASENALNTWRGVYNNYFVTQARRQQKAGHGLPKELLGKIDSRNVSPQEMREIFSSLETMSRSLIRSDLADFPEDSLIAKAFEQFHLSLAADGYSGFAWANVTDNYALTPFPEDFNLGAEAGFRNWAGNVDETKIGNFNAPARIQAPLENYFVNVVPTNPLAIHSSVQIGDLLRASPTGEWDQVTMGNMVDASRYMEFFEKQALHALESAPTRAEDSFQIPSMLQTQIDKEREIIGSAFLIEQQMEQSIERLVALGRDERFPQFVKHPDEYLISQGITEPEVYPEVLESGWMSANKERRDAAQSVMEHARERIAKYREARDVVERLRTRIAGETPQGQPIRSVSDLAALQDSELQELRTYIEWVNNLDKSVKELALQDTKEINFLIDLLGSEEYSSAKEILGTANDLMFTNRFGDPMIRDFATADVLDHNFRAGWRPVGVRSQGSPDVVEAMMMADTYRGKGGSRGFMKYYDKAHNVLKGYMIMSPGFIMRNLYGGMFMNWLAGVSPVRYSQFMKAYSRLAMEREVSVGRASDRDLAKLIKSQGKVPEEHMVYVRELSDSGAFGPGQAGVEFRDTSQPINVGGREVTFQNLKPWSSSFLPLRGMRKLNVKAETILRGTIGFDRLASGQTIENAFDDIIKFHFDYDDLSKFEREGIKRLIPFYTWTRRAIPLMMEQYAVNPAPFHRYMQGMQALEAEPGTREGQVMPKWLLRQGGVPTDIELFGQGGPGNSLFFAPDLPMRTFYDIVNPMFKGDMSPTERLSEGLRAAASMVTPMFKAPLEAGFQRNIWKGYNFDGRYEYVPSAFKIIPGLMPMLSAAGLARRTPNGEWAMQDSHLHAMTQTLPPFAQARRLFPDETRYQERMLSTWMSFTFGLGVRTNTDYEQQMEIRGRTYRKRDEINAIRQLERIDAGKR